jgi:hypothetical protein
VGLYVQAPAGSTLTLRLDEYALVDLREFGLKLTDLRFR